MLEIYTIFLICLILQAMYSRLLQEFKPVYCLQHDSWNVFRCI